MSEGSKLTPKQQRFIEEYLVDLNATQAAIRAGYAVGCADVTASKLLVNPKVAAEIEMRRGELKRKTEITQERVLEQYANIAFVDKRAFFLPSGALKPISEWTPEMAAAVSGLDVIEQSGGDGSSMAVIKRLKLLDSKAALDSLARHLGMFKDKVEISVDEALAERLARAKSRMKQ